MVIVVIGAGIVGLHVAVALRAMSHEVFVLEGETYLGEHTSGRNSGVIHSGIFYSPCSFKETLCLEGNHLTYEWIERLHVPHLPCGKWIVPEKGQEEELEPFFEKIRRLPMPTPKMLPKDRVVAMEPALRPMKAIFVPSTGILDAASYVKAMSRYAEDRGVSVILNCQLLETHDSRLVTTRGDMDFDLAINCAGLFADEVARMAGVSHFQIRPCRGDYFIAAKPLIRKPVYHLPYTGAAGLGVHLTPTMDDQILVGPNAFFIEEKTDYGHRSDPEAYRNAVQYFLPDVDCGLTPGYSGNRPKLYENGLPCPEFKVFRKNGWIHLLGIESPGLTCAPALARHVARLL